MLELASIAVILGGVHLWTAVALAYVLRLPYKQFLAWNTGIAAVLAVALRVSEPAWKDRIGAVLSLEKRQGELSEDALATLVILVSSGLAYTWVISQQYGLEGWLGLVGANTIVNAIL
jgi:hypothetical protein